jgi:Uncharacterized conserved protein (DUF2183)
MPQPRDVDSSRHSYTGGHFRQRLKNLVGTYVDTKVRPKTDASTTSRSVEKGFAEEDKLNKVDAKDSAAAGEEKLVIFPTYAKVKPHLFHALHGHTSTSEHGTDSHYCANVVDIDLHIHGHVSIPHPPNAPLKRKDKIILGMARQICGLPPLPTNTTPGVVKQKSMDILQRLSGKSSPGQSPQIGASDDIVDEPDLIDLDSPATRSLRPNLSRSSTGSEFTLNHNSSFCVSMEKFTPPTRSNTVPTPPTSSSSPISLMKGSWKNSNNFPMLDLATCHANLMERVAPFIARSVAGRLVTIKVYGPPSTADLDSRQIIAQRQFLTNERGHFTGRLIINPPQNSTPPDTWTITASLSGHGTSLTVQEEVKFIPEHGISLISDIDDTVKHTSILSGARELFRNTFVRDLSSMSIEGVREWYSQLTNMGVQIHYVSNSPYQCWPIINSYMTAVGLPRGVSVHLKQYSGMISGIWENAAEKKRAGVETIVRVCCSHY